MGHPAESLTVREREVLKLLGQGNTSKEIAAQLQTSVATVAAHRKQLCRKLNIHTTAAVVLRGSLNPTQ